ncbi:hypothetical protein GQ457_10G005620 [Hibiscus cannabinus]
MGQVARRVGRWLDQGAGSLVGLPGSATKGHRDLAALAPFSNDPRPPFKSPAWLLSKYRFGITGGGPKRFPTIVLNCGCGHCRGCGRSVAVAVAADVT